MSSDAALARLEGVCSRLEALEVRLSSSSGAGAPARWARRPHARETRALVRTFSKTFEEVRGGSCSPFSPRRARSRAAGFRAPCVQCCVPAHARHRAAGGAWVRRMAADASSSRCPRHRARLWDTTLIALVVVQWRDRRGGRCGISGCGGALCEGI